MKLFLSIVIPFLFTNYCLLAQCDDFNLETLNLSSQSQIDQFDLSNHHNCPDFSSITIDGPDIVSLEPLKVIESSKYLQISNTSLINLKGLENLKTDFISIAGPSITSLEGMPNNSILTRLIIDNTSLENLSGLENLRRVTEFEISGQPPTWQASILAIRNNLKLQSLNGLDSLRSAGTIEIVNNPELQNLNALTNCSVENEGPSQFSGWVFGYQLKVENNDRLKKLEGLESISSAYKIDIIDNDSLLSLSGLNNLIELDVRDGLESRDGFLTIANNKMLLNLSGLSNLNVVRTLKINNNESLVSLHGIHSDTIALKSLEITENENLSSFYKFPFFYQSYIIENAVYEQQTKLIIENNTSLNICNEPQICFALENHFEDYSVLQFEGNSSDCGSIDDMLSECNSLLQPTIKLTTQEEITQFALEFSDYKYFDSLLLEGNSIFSIEDLNFIEACKFLEIKNTSISEIQAFGNNTCIGNIVLIDNSMLEEVYFSFQPDSHLDELRIENNDALKEFPLFHNLSEIEELIIADNDNLETIESFTELKSIGLLVVNMNNSLHSLSGFGNIEKIEELIIADNDNLETIENLTELKSIGLLEINKNNSLYDLSGFENVHSFQNISIENNLNLTSIIHLRSSTKPDSIIIHSNEKLNTCNSQLICLALKDTTNTSIQIYNNGQDCMNNVMVLDFCDNVCNFYITEQNEIDSFWINNPYCNVNNMEISGASIHSLTGLYGINSINSLTINDTRIEDLDGLQTLTTLANLKIINNENLQTISGLDENTFLDPIQPEMSNVEIGNNSKLETIDLSFNPNGIIDQLIIENNDALSKSNFKNLRFVNDLIIKDNDNLETLSNFANLRSVKFFNIIGNNSLSNLQGIEYIQSIDNLAIENNSSLISILHLTEDITIDSLIIHSNENLNTCNSKLICKALQGNSNTNIQIYDNGEDCRSEKMVLNFCAESCNFYITEQNEIDRFWLNNAYCNVNHMEIIGESVYSLSGLYGLNTIKTLTLDGTLVEDLNGLQSLIKLPNLNIRNNENLKSISQLNENTVLDSMASEVINVEFVNNKINSFDGLENLVYASKFVIQKNLSSSPIIFFLNNFKGIYPSDTQSATGMYISETNFVFIGLPVLEYTGDTLHLKNNSILSSIEFAHLTNYTLIENLIIENNAILNSIGSFEYLTTNVSSNQNGFIFIIRNNPAYDKCVADGLCSLYFKYDDHFDFSINNNGSGCDGGISLCKSSNSHQETKDRFKVYPQPTTGQLHVILDDTYYNLEIKIIDQLGNPILNQSLNNKSYFQINIDHLTNGIYYLLINNEEELITKKRIIKF